MMTSATIGIIGAGLSGITAARKLADAGFQVILLEKHRTYGGRLCHSTLSWGEVDMGAQYFTARNSGFIRKLAHLMHKGLAEKWSFQPYTFDGSSLIQSADNQTRYVGTPAMASLLDDDVRGLNIHFNTEVSNIENNISNVSVATTTGIRYQFDWLISTCPPQQSSALISDFDPQIQDVGLSPTWSVAFNTAAISNTDAQGIFVNNGIVSWIANNSAKPQRHNQPDTQNWVVHFDPSWSRENIDATREEITAIAQQQLERVFTVKLNIQFARAKLWRYATSESTPPTRPSILTSKQVILTGDWLWGGRVENAWLSGQAAANHVLTELSHASTFEIA